MSRRVLTGLAAVALAGAVGLTAAGCSNTPAPSPAVPNPATAAPIAAEHNDADVSFAQAMIPHHDQAITMAEQASTRASSPQVKDLADRIEAAQGPEIGRMTTMLTTWNAPPVAPGTTATPGMTSGVGGMPGMMTDGQMNQLAGLSGEVFDRAFLQMMLGHHSGAITMSRTELALGLNPQARTLANAIIAAQQREIGEMQTMLDPG